MDYLGKSVFHEVKITLVAFIFRTPRNSSAGGLYRPWDRPRSSSGRCCL